MEKDLPLWTTSLSPFGGQAAWAEGGESGMAPDAAGLSSAHGCPVQAALRDSLSGERGYLEVM